MLAAASLAGAFNILKAEFEAEHSNIRVTISYGPSGGLAKQIESGAPADVFASAGQAEMDRLDSAGLIAPDSRFDFAANELCLITRSGVTLEDWEDLTAIEECEQAELIDEEVWEFSNEMEEEEICDLCY